MVCGVVHGLTWAVSGSRERSIGLQNCGVWMGVAKSMNYNPEVGYLLNMNSSLPFFRYTWLKSKFTEDA